MPLVVWHSVQSHCVITIVFLFHQTAKHEVISTIIVIMSQAFSLFAINWFAITLFFSFIYLFFFLLNDGREMFHFFFPFTLDRCTRQKPR